MSDCKITPAAQRVIDSADLRRDESLEDGARRVAIDAVYETRNDGGTMHDAGAAAAAAVLALADGGAAAAHPPLLGEGAALTDGAPLRERQHAALAKAAEAMDAGATWPGRTPPTGGAISEATARAVGAYLDAMRESEAAIA